MNFRQMLNELAKLKRPTEAEIRKAAAILQRAGFKISPPEVARVWNRGKITPAAPQSQFKRRAPAPGQQTGLPLRGWEDRVESAPERDTSWDSLLQGQMYPVESSNLHSIGFRVANAGDKVGTLLVRFLGQQEGGVRSGVGSLYEYLSVPLELFERFMRAASKGIFLWDEVRIRGSVSGHRFQYQLAGVTSQYVASLGQTVQSYVPRQAALRRGQEGEHFVKRTFRVGEIRGGRLQSVKVESQLRPGVASMRGPPLTRGPGSSALRFQSGR